jgi:acetyltransferase-like isoleucine patch superfamily enzyme
MKIDDKILNKYLAGDVSSTEFIASFLDLLHDLPFKKNDRNNQIRRDITLRMMSAFLTDDERAELFGLPSGCRIREGAKIISKENLVIGENCWIGENAVLDASGGLQIGDNTSIGLGVFVWTHTSHLSNLYGDNQIGSSKIKRKKTSIGSNCFIGGPSVILPGVTIGDRCVIRPLSLVDKDVPSRTVR